MGINLQKGLRPGILRSECVEVINFAVSEIAKKKGAPALSGREARGPPPPASLAASMFADGFFSSSGNSQADSYYAMEMWRARTG